MSFVTRRRSLLLASSGIFSLASAAPALAHHRRYAAAGKYLVFNSYARAQNDWSKPDVERLFVLGDSYSYPHSSAFVNLWDRQLVAEGSVREVVNLAVVGATAADRTINGLLRPFSAQVSQWLATVPELGARDLTAVYFGQNDIYKFSSLTASLAGLSTGLDRLIAAGATANGRRLFLVLVHDVQRNPGASATSAARYLAWVPAVARIAAARPHVIMIDLTTAINKAYVNPGFVQLTNVTTPDAARSTTTALYLDTVHFGFRGHQLISQIIRHYLTRGWDEAHQFVPGSDDARLRLSQAMAAGNVYRTV